MVFQLQEGLMHQEGLALACLPGSLLRRNGLAMCALPGQSLASQSLHFMEVVVSWSCFSNAWASKVYVLDLGHRGLQNVWS